ncbi:putative Phosphate-binding protein PstS 2 [Anaerococcus lactolyticus ATCC 51172]|uniref:Putative Phosphate-binding protein PstS 2 n=1 Tax=Anaerococcus lactolyticus ATCC 51172 TaxID=525254 RepID=C2BEC7_9FIRM|nr:substrate-binding domain-containing protein [Anaerococcus lactolyticus]EEI86769.1 putative Phosphate-binding protein PstS 2 [Anaerococcus lactolyticus ATCC 51172]
MKITNKKILAATLSLGLILAGCGKDQKAEEKQGETQTEQAPAEKEESTETANQEDYDFTVVSREEGSGTRGAFIELVGLEEEVNGSKEDMTTQEAIVQNSTNGVMQTVSQDKEAIGYISLGSLNDTVKALKIEGVEATEENIVNGTYKISRPFNLAYKEDKINDLAKDFLKFCLSEQAQTLTLEEGYVPLKDTEKYEPAKVSGTLTVAGSTSVTPLMQKMAEKYQELNPDSKIEIQSTGSSAGIEAVIDGAADIAMASRELKDEEKDKLAVEVIATDGIAVVVNPSSKVENLTMNELKQIFKGELRNTSKLGK